ncbi:class I SAM-dependent methyltransferase [Serratia marcescens]|nr:class I SAM-dependent methyltransferase [Serratia marcescens]
MSNSNSHKNAVDRQFGEQANAYLTSAVHAQGKDLQRLAQLLAPHADARLLDLGCGAGHASFTAAARVAQVVAYDLSAQMLAVVKQAAAEKGLGNIQLQQGVAESLPFEDASFDLVISRYSAHHWHDVGQALREVTSDRLMLEFDSWVARMRTPAHFVTAIRALQQSVSQEVAEHFAIQLDGSFTSDIMMFEVTKG